MAKRLSGRQILARNMRLLRDDRGWSQEFLAEKAGLHRTYIGAIEREERNVSVDNLDRIARAFRISTATLISR